MIGVGAALNDGLDAHDGDAQLPLGISHSERRRADERERLVRRPSVYGVDRGEIDLVAFGPVEVEDDIHAVEAERVALPQILIDEAVGACPAGETIGAMAAD